MDTPTREMPAILIAGGPLRLIRGYEVVAATGDVVFIGAHDGPLLSLEGPQTTLVMSIDFAPKLIAALQAMMIEPVAAAGAHDAELREMGYTPIPR